MTVALLLTAAWAAVMAAACFALARDEPRTGMAWAGLGGLVAAGGVVLALTNAGRSPGLDGLYVVGAFTGFALAVLFITEINPEELDQ